MLLAALVVTFIIALAFAIAGFTGAPYVPVLRRDHNDLLALANLKPGETLVDLGSGDGYLLRAAARRGIRGIGYEINPFMVFISRIACFRYRHLISIHLADFWRLKLPQSDAIYIFLLPRYMSRLDAKLSAELKTPTRVVSYTFQIPGRRYVKKTRNSYLYQY